jgi:ABC-type uncharacterized transport system ATPase subunit
MVFQHFSLFEALTVAENIALSLDDVIADRQDRRRGEGAVACLWPAARSARACRRSVRRRAPAHRDRPRLLQNPKLIILDEPTSVLTPQEADKLFETLFKLKAEGRSVLYISHRLEEVQRICDRATVLRHGKVTGACVPREETPASLARMMVGNDVASVTHRRPRQQRRRPAGCVSPLGRGPAHPLPCR